MTKQSLLSQSSDSDLFFQFNSPIQNNVGTNLNIRDHHTQTHPQQSNGAVNGTDSILINRAYNYTYKYSNTNAGSTADTTNDQTDDNSGMNGNQRSKLSQQINKLDSIMQDGREDDLDLDEDDHMLDEDEDDDDDEFELAGNGNGNGEDDEEDDEDDDDLELEEEFRNNYTTTNTNKDTLARTTTTTGNPSSSNSLSSSSLQFDKGNTPDIINDDEINNSNSKHMNRNNSMSNGAEYAFSINSASTREILSSSSNSQMTMEQPPSYKSHGTMMTFDSSLQKDNNSNVYNHQNDFINSIGNTDVPDTTFSDSIRRLSIEENNNHNIHTSMLPPKLSGSSNSSNNGNNNNIVVKRKQNQSLPPPYLKSRIQITQSSATPSSSSQHRKNKLFQKNKDSLNQNRMFSHYNNILSERFTVNPTATPPFSSLSSSSSSQQHHHQQSSSRNGSISNSSNNSKSRTNSSSTKDKGKWIDAKDMVDEYWIYGKHNVLHEDMFESSSDEE